MLPLLLGGVVACGWQAADTGTTPDTGTSVTEETGRRDSADTGDSGSTRDSGEPIDSALFGLDSDGDGLSDGLEQQLGWDPQSDDTDGDGFSDGEEHAAGTDGAAAWSWPLDGCRWPDLYEEGAALVGDGVTGWNDREFVPDLAFTDQCGGPVSLWQFPGHVIILDMAATWCAPCQESAAMLQGTFQAHRDRGYVLLTGLQGAALEDAQAWAERYGSTHPVLADSDSTLFDAISGRTTTYPSYVLVDADLTVRTLRMGETPQSWFDLYVPGLQDERDAAGR